MIERYTPQNGRHKTPKHYHVQNNRRTKKNAYDKNRKTQSLESMQALYVPFATIACSMHYYCFHMMILFHFAASQILLLSKQDHS